MPCRAAPSRAAPSWLNKQSCLFPFLPSKTNLQQNSRYALLYFVGGDLPARGGPLWLTSLSLLLPLRDPGGLPVSPYGGLSHPLATDGLRAGTRRLSPRGLLLPSPAACWSSAVLGKRASRTDHGRSLLPLGSSSCCSVACPTGPLCPAAAARHGGLRLHYECTSPLDLRVASSSCAFRVRQLLAHPHGDAQLLRTSNRDLGGLPHGVYGYPLRRRPGRSLHLMNVHPRQTTVWPPLCSTFHRCSAMAGPTGPMSPTTAARYGGLHLRCEEHVAVRLTSQCALRMRSQGIRLLRTCPTGCWRSRGTYKRDLDVGSPRTRRLPTGFSSSAFCGG